MSDPRKPGAGGDDSVLLLTEVSEEPPLGDGERANDSTKESPLDNLVATVRLPGWRRFAWIAMLLIVAFLGWAYIAEFDEVAIAPGEIVPRENVKVVQHLEGGIIETIHVREGQLVKSGDQLVSLDLRSASMNDAELQVQLDALLLRRARLEAESSGTTPIFPENVVRRRPGLARSEGATFHARRIERETADKALSAQVVQRQQGVKELKAARRAIAIDLGLARQELKMSSDLLEAGLTAKIEHLKRRREVKKLEGQLATLKPSIPRAEAALGEARARLEEEEFKARRQAFEELTKVEQGIARTTEYLARATDQVRRAEIRSPIDGVVKNLRYHTIGGVVRPGEPIMEIVPSDQNPIVEVRLSPVDRGYVEVGHAATVKVTSYEFIRYGGLKGIVTHIAADANTDNNGNPYFRVFVETEKSYLGEVEGSLPITPGMQAMVDIHTGTRSVMQYLLRPVLKLKHEAFRER